MVDLEDHQIPFEIFLGILKENEVSFDKLLAIVPVSTTKMPEAFKILAGSRPGATHIAFVELMFNFIRSPARNTLHSLAS